MIIGIAIPSLIVLLGGLFTYGYINDTENREGYVLIADDLKEHVLEVRRNEKIYFHFKNVEHLDNLLNAISILNSSINDIPLEIVSEMGKKDISILQDSIQEYPDLINILHENYQDETKITEEVRGEGRKLEAFASYGKHAKEITTSFVLHLRLIEKNYMLFRDKKSFAELNSGISQMKNITPLCYKCVPYIKAVNDLFANYNKSDSLVYEIQINGSKLEEVAGRIAVRERQRISSFFKKARHFLIVVLILICILGPLFVYKTAAYIVAPIKRLAEITNKIADGDTNLRAPLREHDESYSLAMSFNKMLDQLNLTHQSLEKSLNLLHEKQAQLVESEKRASIGLLVSGVAHELNNPLNNISLTTETIMEDLEEFNPEELKDNLHDILSQSHRAHDIVENLLDFARARRSTDMEKLDIVNVVRGSIRLVSNQLRVNNIILDTNIPDSAFYIKGNLSKLEQIFVNVIINAVQAMKETGTLTVSVKPDAENANVLVKISDTGPGISKEDLKNIFEPFFTTKAVGKGTGLGLSVSHGLVREHKGEIDVESKVGKGTTFTIKFPQYEEPA
jgi:signal transduction histidine kinase